MLVLGGIADDGNIKTDITCPIGAKGDFKTVGLENDINLNFFKISEFVSVQKIRKCYNSLTNSQPTLTWHIVVRNNDKLVR